MTLATRIVLQELLHDPTRERYGREICLKTGLASGVVNPILTRLHRLGWLDRRWENDDDTDAGQSRARRRFYWMTAAGKAAARAAIKPAKT